MSRPICLTGRWRSNPYGKCSQERLTRGTITSTMHRAAHPSGCARCGAGASCSVLRYQSLTGGGYRGKGSALCRVHPLSCLDSTNRHSACVKYPDRFFWQRWDSVDLGGSSFLRARYPYKLKCPASNREGISWKRGGKAPSRSMAGRLRMSGPTAWSLSPYIPHVNIHGLYTYTSSQIYVLLNAYIIRAYGI